MISLKQAWNAWKKYWFGQVAVEPLVVARIGLGASMFTAYVMYYPFLDELFGPDGLGAYTMGRDHFIREHLPLVWSMTVLSSVCFTLGFLTPLSGALLIAGHLIFIEPGRFLVGDGFRLCLRSWAT